MDSAKGRVAPTKTDEFSEKFHTAYDPPSISNNHIAIFSKSPFQALYKGPKSAR